MWRELPVILDDGTALRLGTPITGIPSTGYADTLTGG